MFVKQRQNENKLTAGLRLSTRKVTIGKQPVVGKRRTIECSKK